MTNGAITMEDNDRAWIKDLFNTRLIPIEKDIKEIKDNYKDLPCGDHTIKLTQIETRQQNGNTQKIQDQVVKKDTRNFVVKLLSVSIAIMTLITLTLGALYKLGFFKILAQ